MPVPKGKKGKQNKTKGMNIFVLLVLHYFFNEYDNDIIVLIAKKEDWPEVNSDMEMDLSDEKPLMPVSKEKKGKHHKSVKGIFISFKLIFLNNLIIYN